MRKLLACIVLASFICAGCTEFVQALHNAAADPNTSAAIEAGATGVAGVASFFGPIGAMIGTGVLGAVTVWRKFKPSLAAATTKAEQFQAAGAAMTTAIEAYKAANPDQWASLGELIEGQLARQGLDPLVIENVIRGLRGLPAKEAI